MTPVSISKYLHTRGIKGPWKISGNERDDFQGAVVIPALAEKDSLAFTLESIERNPAKDLTRFLIVVVVNNRNDADHQVRLDNEATLKFLAENSRSSNALRIAWIDAATDRMGLPQKGGGVGLARKIGLDLALSRLDFKGPPPLLISLDADTLVRPDYLPAIREHFQKVNTGGAVISFCHQQGATSRQDQAIRYYELFLRTYVVGLEKAGSPYAFHTVGSTMVCTADAYIRMGGMNTREAAEDFYFLQHLAKTGGVSQIKGTVVHPSPRISNRVPFGTGPSMARLMADGPRSVLFYRQECFQILKDWLDLISTNLDRAGVEVLAGAKYISEDLAVYLERLDFVNTWAKLRRNLRSPFHLRSGFHQWFDAFKTLKLIHHLSAGPFPRGEPEQVLPDFFRWARIDVGDGIEDQLLLLRRIQIGKDAERI